MNTDPKSPRSAETPQPPEFKWEAEKVYGNLHRDHRQVARYVVNRCGDFFTDGERELFITAFLRAAASAPPAQPAEVDWYIGDTGTESRWRQCTICSGYASGQPNEPLHVRHTPRCPVAEVERLRAVSAPHPQPAESDLVQQLDALRDKWLADSDEAEAFADNDIGRKNFDARRSPDGDGQGLIARATDVNTDRQGMAVGRLAGRRPDRTKASDTPNPTTKIADEQPREVTVASVVNDALAGSEPADARPSPKPQQEPK